MPNFALRVCLLASLALVGCAPEPQWVSLPSVPPEVPPVNVPLSLRQTNWPDARGSGSCVIASSISHLHWCNRPDLAARFRASYAGGQTASSIQRIWQANGLPYVCTEDGDPTFLEWASRTRRGAILWYFPSHCCTFCGYSVVDGVEHAMILDNNRVRQFIRIPKREFLTRWRGYGGFAMTAILPPAPPLPSRGYEVR